MIKIAHFAEVDENNIVTRVLVVDNANEDTCLWNAPTPMPTDGKLYRWVEEDLNWQEIVLPQE